MSRSLSVSNPLTFAGKNELDRSRVVSGGCFRRFHEYRARTRETRKNVSRQECRDGDRPSRRLFHWQGSGCDSGWATAWSLLRASCSLLVCNWKAMGMGDR